MSGENAFLRCAGIVRQVPAYLWKNSLLYEIAVLSQRKLLFKLLLEQAKQVDSQKRIQWVRLEDSLKVQITMLGRLFGQVQQGRIEDGIFDTISPAKTLILITLLPASPAKSSSPTHQSSPPSVLPGQPHPAPLGKLPENQPASGAYHFLPARP